MLRKLLKHEFRATGRIMLPMYLILLVTAVGSNLAGRGMLDGRYHILNILGVLIVTAFGIAICGALLMSFVLMIQRFYKNLLQDEGYLMFTLPASVHQHIWSKLIVSSVWFIVTVLAIIAASLVVAYQGGFLRELLESLPGVPEAGAAAQSAGDPNGNAETAPLINVVCFWMPVLLLCGICPKMVCIFPVRWNAAFFAVLKSCPAEKSWELLPVTWI